MCREIRGGGDFRPIILFKLSLRERARSTHSKKQTGGGGIGGGDHDQDAAVTRRPQTWLIRKVDVDHLSCPLTAYESLMRSM